MLICQVREAARNATEGLTDDGKAPPTARKGKGKGRRRAKDKVGTLDQGVDKKRKGADEKPSDSVKKNKSHEEEPPKEHPAGESGTNPPCDPPNPPTKNRRTPKPKPSSDDIQEAWKEQELLKLDFRCCFVQYFKVWDVLGKLLSSNMSGERTCDLWDSYCGRFSWHSEILHNSAQ